MTTTTERHRCGVTTRSGQPCRNMTTGGPCPSHDPDRTCGAPNGRGGTCRRIVAPGRLCDEHDPAAVDRRRHAARAQDDAAARDRAAGRAADRARAVEVDALVATLNGCPDCTPLVLRAALLVEPVDPFEDEDAPTPLSVAWSVVVEHLRLGHGLPARADTRPDTGRTP